MRPVNYVGYYDIPANADEARSYTPSAATKMDYICGVLNDLGRSVRIVSMSPTSTKKMFRGKTTPLNERTTLKLFPTLPWGNPFLRTLRFVSSRLMLLFFLLFQCERGEDVIVYHTTPMQTVVWLAKKLRHFRLILEVEEIFQDVRPLRPWARCLEYAEFGVADAFILSTESLNGKVNHGRKPYSVIYGTYRVEPPMDATFGDDLVHVVYAGTLSTQKKGAMTAVDVALFLDSRFYIHILGFGSPNELAKVRERISSVSRRTSCNVSYDGLLQGEDFVTFLQKCDIGLATQDSDALFNESSFPSKILSYMANGLAVVSTRVPAVLRSKLSSRIVFCDSQDPAEVARAIRSVDLDARLTGHEVLNGLDKEFRRELAALLSPERGYRSNDVERH